MSLNRIQYDNIIREYERIATKHKHEADRRREELYKEFPQLLEISDEISAISVATAKAKLLGQISSLSDYKSKMNELISRRTDILNNAGYPDNYLDITYDCSDCRDTGYTGTGTKCHCFKKRELEVLYAQSGVKDMVKTENFNTFCFDFYSDDNIDEVTGLSALTNIRNAVTVCKDFIKTFDNSFMNLYIYGKTGVGKTFLTHCIASELLNTSHSVIYLSAVQLFDLLAADTFKNANSGIIDDITNCDLLIIDDLGTEMTNSFTISALFNCLNERLLKKRSTIISSNLSFNKILDNYTDRLLSRILGNYKILKIFGDDIRLKKRK